VFNSSDGGVPLGRSPWNLSWTSVSGQRTTCRRNTAENINRLSRVHERYTDRTTDGRRQHIANVNVSSRSQKNDVRAVLQWSKSRVYWLVNETLWYETETRPRHLETTSRDRLETETSRPRLHPCYRWNKDYHYHKVDYYGGEIPIKHSRKTRRIEQELSKCWDGRPWRAKCTVSDWSCGDTACSQINTVIPHRLGCLPFRGLIRIPLLVYKVAVLCSNRRIKNQLD